MKADKYIERTGPTGNGYSRIHDRKTGRDGYIDNYGNVVLDPEPRDDPEPKQSSFEDDPEFQARLQSTRQPGGDHYAKGGPSAGAPQKDPGLGVLPILAGIFAGIAMADHDAKARRQRQSAYSPPPAPAAKEEDKSGALDTIVGLALLLLLGRLALLALMTLFGGCTIPRFLLNLAGTLAGAVALVFLADKLKKLFQ